MNQMKAEEQQPEVEVWKIKKYMQRDWWDASELCPQVGSTAFALRGTCQMFWYRCGSRATPGTARGWEQAGAPVTFLKLSE